MNYTRYSHDHKTKGRVKPLRQVKLTKPALRVLVIIILAVIGTIVLIRSRAATNVSSIEAENGSMSNPNLVINDPSASKLKAIRFSSTKGPGLGEQITPGAESNYNMLPYIPPHDPTGRLITAAANSTDIANKINSASPGDIIEVDPGTVTGNINITSSGTLGNPIVLRSKIKNGTSFNCSTDNCIGINGSYIVIQQFRFAGTGRYAISIRGDENFIYDNLFDQTGSGADASSSSVVFINGPNYLRMMNTKIIKNTFNKPKNAAIFNANGAGGTTISHNIIQGPHGIGPGEREAFKFGCCASDPVGDYNNHVQFNSFYNWGVTYPYLSQFKRGGSYLAYNKVISDLPTDDNDILSSRSDNNKFVGNLMIGKSAMFELGSGTNLTIKYNKLFSTGNTFGKSSWNIWGNGTFGAGNPFTKVTNSLFSSNVVFLDSPSEPYDTLFGSSGGTQSSPPTNNTFENNIFGRGDSPNQWFDTNWLYNNGNVWRNNTFTCRNSCTQGQISNTYVLGSNGNVTGAANYNPTDKNQKVTFDPQYVLPAK